MRGQGYAVAVDTRPRGRPRQIDEDILLEALIRAQVKRMAHGMVGPSVGRWDRERPSYLPTTTGIKARLGKGWPQMVQECGLLPASGSRNGDDDGTT